ncbi:MAG: Methionyl-tRNA formyltransferase [Candidatus Adlerbacteria bacterium]|nr:Methionyl-tRNA formyltransferase [Candidatus Adlerbacteria bacterium]
MFAFFGTPRFSVKVLDALESHGMLPAVVVCAPDKPRGRGLEPAPAPTKVWAEARGITVVTPATLRDPAAAEDLMDILANTDWDVFVVAAYAKLIPKHILDIPRRGCLNIHPSLLPKFRGPSPALSAILADERTTGVSIMLLDEQMDHGPVIAQGRIVLDEADWPPQGSVFEDLLATEGGNLLAEAMPDWIAGTIEAEPQNEDEATFTKKFTDADALIDLAGDPRTNLLKIRAFDKGPRAYFVTPSGKRVIITAAHTENDVLVIDTVIPEGKKEMPYSDFMRGQTNK